MELKLVGFTDQGHFQIETIFLNLIQGIIIK